MNKILFRSFTGNDMKGERVGDIIDLEDNRQTDDQGKANAFANRLRESHAFPELANFSDICKDDLNEAYNALSHFFTPAFGDNQAEPTIALDFPADRDSAEKITSREVDEHLRKAKAKAAGGPDNITYDHLKKGGGKLIALLTYLFNILLITGYFPLRWRCVNVRMLHKSGKAKLPVSNYRPISLSSCLSKLYECCIKTRFEKKLSRVRTENFRQSAYKRKRGTQENCVKLVESVTDAMNSRGCVLSTFLDVSGAFDRVWREGLIVKIARWGVGRRLSSIIANFLTSRSLIVKVANAVSDMVHLLAGTPQGSVLSPILFNAFMDDVRERIPEGVELLQYADDICIYVNGVDPKLCQNRIQEALDVIACWAGIWRVTMAPEKSSWILFTKCPSLKRQQLSLKMNNELIPRVDNVKFLGVNFDCGLTWKYHIDHLTRHATSKSIQIQSLAAKTGFKSIPEAIGFFNAVVKPIFDYGAPVYLAMNHGQWAKIDRLHGKFLRSICNLPRCCSYDKLCNQLHLERLSFQIKDQAAKRVAAICNSSPYADEWLANRGSLRRNGFYQSAPGRNNNNNTYWSPVEIGLERFIQLTDLLND